MARSEEPLSPQDIWNAVFQTAQNAIKVQREQQSNLTVLATGAITISTEHTPLTGLGQYNNAIIQAIFATLTLPDGDDVIDVYLQTSFDGGTTWVDIENVHFETTEDGNTPTFIFMIGPAVVGTTTGRTPTDGTITDDTKVDVPLGDRIRFKTLLAGATAPTYNFTAVGKFW